MKKVKKKKKNKGEKRKKKKGKDKKKGEKSLAASHPSVETPGALDRRAHWESQETPAAQSHLSALVHITGYRHSGCRPGSSRIDSVRGGHVSLLSSLPLNLYNILK